MSGFFPSDAANKLTELSNHYVDWSRVGELLRSARHRYSRNELIQRGVILAAMGYGGYRGYNMADEGIMPSGLYSMAGCFVGFVVSHTLVILPLIYKRRAISTQCQNHEEHILDLLQSLKSLSPDNQNLSLLVNTISTAVKEVMALSLSNQKGSRASQTWGTRLSLLQKIETKLIQDIKTVEHDSMTESSLNALNQFWKQPQKQLHNDLNNQPTLSSSSFQLGSPSM